MKVVINKCYGGFGFSDEFKYHALLNEPSLFETRKPEKYFGTKKKFQDVLDGKDNLTTITNDFGDFLGLGSKFSGIHVFYNKTDKLLYNLHETSDSSFRSNPKLIKLLEDFGLEQSAGNYAELKIVDVPDGVSFEISDYDGVEHVAQSHSTWG